MIPLRFRPILCLVVFSLPLGFVPSAIAEQLPVDEELERLAGEHGFKVTGIEATVEAMGRVSSNELLPRLRRLLEDFDYVILQAPKGGVDRVIVLGEKVPFVPAPRQASETAGGGEDASAPAGASGEIVAKTERRGTQHAVSVSLEGKDGKRTTHSLLIDTGADFVALPASLVSQLGIAADALKESDLQTANGRAKARVGTIPALWIGEHRIPDVQVAFLDDGKLGSGGLLGMSVLGRYVMTIDDKAGSLTLAQKGAAPVDKESTDKETADKDAADKETAEAPAGEKIAQPGEPTSTTQSTTPRSAR